MPALWTSTLLVALAEIGDTTLGMMIANVPAVIMGEKLAHRVPMKVVRWLAASLFIALGLATLMRH